ncbi:hypothetical protein IFT69_15415 [Pseudomonas putida]|nr:hypothetical protein [Pseudomonas putida]
MSQPFRLSAIAGACLFAGLSQYAVAGTVDEAKCLAQPDTLKAEACLHTTGKPFARLHVRSNGEQVVIDKPAVIEGDYAEYLKGDADNLNSPLLLRALENEGQGLAVSASAVDSANENYTLRLKAKPYDQKPYRGAVMLSNSGPDISGRDILSWYHRQLLGQGYVLTTSLTHGFADLRPESKGGKYESAFFSLEKATQYGVFDAQYLYSENTSGGTARLYDLGGTTNRFSLGFTQYLLPSLTLRHQLSYTDRKQDFGAYGIDEKQQFMTYSGKVGYTFAGVDTYLKLTKGLDGKRDYDLIPLMGTFNPYFWSGEADARTSIILPQGLVLNLHATGFKGSKDMPSSERFGLGGAGRGSSHESGLYSGYEGFSYEAQVSRSLANLNGVVISASAGLNGSDITTAIDQDISVMSARVGVDVGYHDWSIQTSYNKSVMSRNLEDDQRLSVDLVWRY